MLASFLVVFDPGFDVNVKYECYIPCSRRRLFFLGLLARDKLKLEGCVGFIILNLIPLEGNPRHTGSLDGNCNFLWNFISFCHDMSFFLQKVMFSFTIKQKVMKEMQFKIFVRV
jgi:hypothetical protein